MQHFKIRSGVCVAIIAIAQAAPASTRIQFTAIPPAPREGYCSSSSSSSSSASTRPYRKRPPKLSFGSDPDEAHRLVRNNFDYQVELQRDEIDLSSDEEEEHENSSGEIHQVTVNLAAASNQDADVGASPKLGELVDNGVGALTGKGTRTNVQGVRPVDVERADSADEVSASAVEDPVSQTMQDVSQSGETKHDRDDAGCDVGCGAQLPSSLSADLPGKPLTLDEDFSNTMESIGRDLARSVMQSPRTRLRPFSLEKQVAKYDTPPKKSVIRGRYLEETKDNSPRRDMYGDAYLPRRDMHCGQDAAEANAVLPHEESARWHRVNRVVVGQNRPIARIQIPNLIANFHDVLEEV